MEREDKVSVECTREGRLVATIDIYAKASDDSLISLDENEANQAGEERFQLRERGRYEYRLREPGLSLLSRNGIQPSRIADNEERGIIEPGDYCGLLPLVVVRRGDPAESPVAFGAVEVRSVKLEYREHYRGMLCDIAERCAGLLLDSRAATRVRLNTLWEKDARVLEQQLEFLRYTLESSAFQGAVNEILRNPHRRLQEHWHDRPISRPFKPDKSFARQVGVASRRLPVPEGHPLRDVLQSVPEGVTVRSRTDFMDTPENRFAKMALSEFRDFLVEVSSHLARLEAKRSKPENQRLLRETARLRGMLESHLSRGFFPEVSRPDLLPIGSPVLQRKSGYRELLRFWLQFHAGAQLRWDGANDVFHAGSRNVATLYEYWLFFQLEALFRSKFQCDKPLHSVVVRKGDIPHLILQKGVELRAVSGAWSEAAGREMNAVFHFNRKFGVRTKPGSDRESSSWTRGVQPDYTISIWPAAYTVEEAEANELMVHVHFDAKYRVDKVSDLFGDDDAEFEDVELVEDKPRTAAKYSDLLKMHAYRDAIRRTAGAYVLYPGNPGDDKEFHGYHEVLPGLGAFAVRPDATGKAAGLEHVSAFLDKVIAHLANRATSRERVTYHVSEAYAKSETEVRETIKPYGAVRLAEEDSFGEEHRAVPPAEDMVLVAWYNNVAQLDLAQAEEGFVYVRLGSRAGAIHVHPNLSRVRSVLMHNKGNVVAPGLLKLREPGFRVHTRASLRKVLAKSGRRGIASWQSLAQVDDEENIYALFATTPSADCEGRVWDGEKIMSLIARFESDARNRPIENLRRLSPYPRILSLRDLIDEQDG